MDERSNRGHGRALKRTDLQIIDCRLWKLLPQFRDSGCDHVDDLDAMHGVERRAAVYIRGGL